MDKKVTTICSEMHPQCPARMLLKPWHAPGSSQCDGDPEPQDRGDTSCGATVTQIAREK